MVKIDKNAGESFVKILEIMSALRDPKTGCEWDKDQDSNSIKSYCIEEAYEVVEAIENNDNEALCEELGDLLFQVIFHSEINNEKGNFSIIDVIDNLSEKVIRRHPHVFENKKKLNEKELTDQWIKIKQLEGKFKETNDPYSSINSYLSDSGMKASPNSIGTITLSASTYSVSYTHLTLPTNREV